MTVNYYFDLTDPLSPYTYSLEANPDSLPPLNAVRTAPKMQDGFWPCWDGEKWIPVEDHRELTGWLDGQAFTIKDLGPLPEGFSETVPEPTPEELRQARITAIKAELLDLDLASIRPLRAIENGADAVEDHARLVEIRKQAEALRVELRKLEAAE